MLMTRPGATTLTAVLLSLLSPCLALTWEPTLQDSPTWHTTSLLLRVAGAEQAPAAVVVDLTCMDTGRWRCRASLGQWPERPLVLRPGDFACTAPGATAAPLDFAAVMRVQVTCDGTTDGTLRALQVEWTQGDGRRLPWEDDPPHVTAGGEPMWPGLHRNNAGHFGWMWASNGLLIDNAGFDHVDRSWYYFKPGREPNESFQFNFTAARADGTVAAVLPTAGETTNKAGLADGESLEADWTSVRRRKAIDAGRDKPCFQEIRYSTLAPGVQAETNAPGLALSFTDRSATRGPAGVVWPSADGVRLSLPGDGIEPEALAHNWLLLLSADGSPEIPVLIALQRKPESVRWSAENLVLQRADGAGTVAVGTAFGLKPLGTDTLSRWRETPREIPVAYLEAFSELLTAYAWGCRELFSVHDEWVHIRDEFTFLPWEDDWGTRPRPQAPLPPLIPYSVDSGALPATCLPATHETGLLTKWGPYRVVEGSVCEYKLPVPECWDEAAPGLPLEPGVAQEILAGTLTEQAIEMLRVDRPAPGKYPHVAAHDMLAGAWRAANFLSPDLRARMRRYAHERVQSALFPQNYRLRRDPVSGATCLACTFVWDRPDEADWEGFADIDYWQGLVLYGLYTQAKYGADWEQMRDHWPLIRGLASYWEATNSWALMGPGARESGELFHGDMPTAGYAGLVGFHRLAQRLGTPYQRDLAAYLLARNAVPMGCKLGFLDYALQAPHQEASWSRLPSTGFGERWLASFPGVDPSVRDYGPKDPWWRTGCIGPQSVQPEVLDLYLRRCPDELLTFERTFMGACPDGAFKTHDEVRVPPHIMARLQLPGDMPRLGVELATAWRRSYLLRDAHIAAALAARDVPLRLIDWTPAYIEQATWEPATRSAGVELTSPEDFGLILAVQGARPSVTIDGVASAVQAGGRRARWRAYTIGMPRGRHVVRVGVSGREG